MNEQTVTMNPTSTIYPEPKAAEPEISQAMNQLCTAASEIKSAVVELETKLRVCLRDVNTCEQPVAPLPPYSCELARRLAVLTEGFRDVHGHLATLIHRCELPQVDAPVCCTNPRR